MKTNLLLEFTEAEKLELHATAFYDESTQRLHRTVRGKTAGAFHGFGTFQWSLAVHAMTILLVRARIHFLATNDESPQPLLIGGHSSAAASLDMSIGAHTRWLSEMFGVDVSGRPISYRLFLRSNSYRKRGGPTTIALNSRRLAPSNIEIRVNEVGAGLVELYRIESSLRGTLRATDLVKDLLFHQGIGGDGGGTCFV